MNELIHVHFPGEWFEGMRPSLWHTLVGVMRVVDTPLIVVILPFLIVAFFIRRWQSLFLKDAADARDICVQVATVHTHCTCVTVTESRHCLDFGSVPRSDKGSVLEQSLAVQRFEGDRFLLVLGGDGDLGW